jgi:hypothetical protein
MKFIFLQLIIPGYALPNHYYRFLVHPLEIVCAKISTFTRERERERERGREREMLVFEFRIPYIPGKCSSTKLYSQPKLFL